MLADAGHVDSFDGHECRVAFRAWAAAGRQRTYIFASPLDEDSVMREADARESRAKEVAAKIREKEWIDAAS